MSESGDNSYVMWTLWNKKPIDYGSTGSDWIVQLTIQAHAFALLLAFLGGCVAVCAKKGRSSRFHLPSGKTFYYGMIIGAMTGIPVDIIRLTTNTAANNTVYTNLSVPSSDPVRICFMYAGTSTISMALNAVYGKNMIFQKFWSTDGTDVKSFAVQFLTKQRLLLWWFPICNLIYGVVSVVWIVYRYNPFYGGLMMIFYFILCHVYNLRYWYKLHDVDSQNARTSGVLFHQFNMIFLYIFCVWGFLQGHVFGSISWITDDWVKPDDNHEYTGDQYKAQWNDISTVYIVMYIPMIVIATALFIYFKRKTTAKIPLKNDELMSGLDDGNRINVETPSDWKA